MSDFILKPDVLSFELNPKKIIFQVGNKGIKGDKGDQGAVGDQLFLDNTIQPSPPLSGAIVYSEDDELKSISPNGTVLEIAKEIALNSVTGVSSGCQLSVNLTSIATIQGNGGSPTNTVTVETTITNGYVGGEVITIAGSTSYDEVGVTIATINSPTNFNYTTTSHTASALESAGTVSDPAAFDISAGEVVEVDNSVQGTPTKNPFSFLGIKNLVDEFPFPNVETYISVDSPNTVLQSDIEPDDLQRRQKASLGSMIKASPTEIFPNAAPIPTYDRGSSLDDLLILLRGIKVSGLKVTPFGSDMSINISDGKTMKLGQKFFTDPETPSISSLSFPSPVAFMGTSYRQADGNGTFHVISNQVQPSVYNPDHAGTVVAVPAKKYTAQRIMVFGATGGVNLVLPSTYYNTLSEAVQARQTEFFIEVPQAYDGAHIATLIVQEGTTDLSQAVTDGKAAIIDEGALRQGNWNGGAQVSTAPIFAHIIDEDDQDILTPNTPQRVNLSTNNSISALGIVHNEKPDPRSFDVLFTIANTYNPFAQLQVNKSGGGASPQNFHVWYRKGVHQEGAITAVSSAAPAVVTSLGHGLATGQTVHIDGIVSAPDDLNTEWTVTYIDDDNFSLDGSDTSTSVTDGLGTWVRTLDATEDIPDSKREIISDSSNFAGSLDLSFPIFFEEGEKLNIMISGSVTNFSIEQTPGVGEPDTPSIRLSI